MMEPNFEFSWIGRTLNGRLLISPVRDQGNRPSCVFNAISASAEQEIKRLVALGILNDKLMDLSFHIPSFIADYEVIVGRPLGYSYQHGDDYAQGRLWSAGHMFLHHGVIAQLPNETDFRTNLEEVKAGGTPDFSVIKELIDAGKPVFGGFTANDLFSHFQRDQIYTHEKRVDLPDFHHMVSFVGYGKRGVFPYLVFLNSGGVTFGDGGFGRIWYQEVFEFHTLRIRNMPIVSPLINHDTFSSWSS